MNPLSLDTVPLLKDCFLTFIFHFFKEVFMKSCIRILSLLAGSVLIGFSFPVAAETEATIAPDLRLYRLSCGSVGVSDLNAFSDTEAYTGKSRELAVSCYLIKHGEDWVLWDTGLPLDTDSMKVPFKLTLKETILQQLEKIELKAEDIDYVVLSHGHVDHSGSAESFPNAKLVIQRADYEFMKGKPDAAKARFMDPSYIEDFIKKEESGGVILLDGDADIFKDGTLKAISLPGHTPGHMALLLNLAETGPVILSGDQWHFKENRTGNGVPTFNFDRADTLASSDKLNHLLENKKAKLVIQHESPENQELPVFPEFLK